MKERRVILLVDDIPAVRDVLGRGLREAGYAVLEADDGRKALRLAIDEKPAVVLLDLRIPGMDGLTVLRRIKKADRNTAVVIMTGDGDIETAREAMRLGARDYLTKPFAPGQLEVLLQDLLVHQA